MKPSFSVALLMGGRSRRMGMDKAFLTDPATGLPFWERQASVLEALEPRHRFLSLRHDQTIPPLPATWQPVLDDVSDAGPMGGMAACLAVMPTDLLLVMAIDLSAMTAEPLRCLLDQCRPGRGAVYRRNGFYEPLAAVYPKAAAGSARSFLDQGKRRVHDWIDELAGAGLMKVCGLAAASEPLFSNVNDPHAYANLVPADEP